MLKISFEINILREVKSLIFFFGHNTAHTHVFHMKGFEEAWKGWEIIHITIFN